MGESLMASVSGALLKKVLALAANEINLYFGFKKQLATLQKSLEYIQAVVRDAEQKQLTSDAVRIWVEDLKGVADRAELVLDEIEYEILRRKVGAKSSSTNSIVFRYQMARKIKNINDSLARINKQAAEYNLHRQLLVVNVTIPPNKNEETDSLLDEFGVLGRDEDAAVLIQSLIGSTPKKKLTIIPIVGMGGIGKTTLAKLIYNDVRVQSHFDVKVWVCVGVKVDDVMTILGQILEFLTRRKEDVTTRETILQRLKENLGGKNYMLVLDDVWNEEGGFWVEFKSCMLKANDGYGNSIIVTTRSKKLATNASQTSVVHSLDQLSDDQCWSIISERVFPNGCPLEDLMGIGVEIARRCYGVPLAAKVVGGMLRSKKGVEEWLSVRNGLVGGSSQEDQVLNILKLSFDNLPNPLLKHCFSYCSIFRKDAVMEKAKLIELWMALGLLEVVEGTGYKDLEDVGLDFFNTLVHNSLFQDVRKDEYGNIISCKMHDLVHDLARSISGSQCLILEGSMSNNTILRVKDLALYNVHKEKIFEVLKHEKGRYVRTLFFEKAGSIITDHICFKNFKCLRILNLRGLSMLPESIGDLIHLRYLDLSYNLGIDVLPKSIGELYHLQTLRLTWCSDELKLPKEVENLISLRHLYIDRRCDIAPFNIGRFTCLQTLEYFRVGKKGRCIQVLGSLKNLRGKLYVDNLENVSSKREALSADLIGKLELHRLKYAWCHNRNPNHEDVLEGLQAPPNLKGLEILGYNGDNFPKWVMKMAVIGMDQKLLPLHNLVDIKFYDCRRCEYVPMLGQLPHLQKLEMRNMENVRCIDKSFYGYCGGTSRSGQPPAVMFPELRSLAMYSMGKLETWMDVTVTRKDTIGEWEGSSWSGGGWLVFPRLEDLYLIECPMIKSLPSEALRGAHLSLKRLKTEGCDNLGTIPTLQGFTSLEELIIRNCIGLACLSELSFHRSLRKLEIQGAFEKLICMPQGYLSGVANTLDELGIGPLSFEPQLMKLCLQSILRIPTSSPSPSPTSSSLLQWQSSPVLRKLTMKGQPHWDSIPEEAQHLTALASLTIRNFGSVEALPEWFAHLSSLEELYLYNCSQLRSLPSMETMGRLTKLKKITIRRCPLLVARVAQGRGPEWSKVSCIPDLHFYHY